MNFLNVTSLTIGAFIFGINTAAAQQLDFQIANASLEQLVVARLQSDRSSQNIFVNTPPPASTSIILQAETGNNASTSIIRSIGGAAAVLQTGDGNQSSAAILNSPASRIASIQLGDDNTVALAIVGGAGNTLAAAQIGSGHNLGVALVNSVGTTVTYGQIGQGVSGSVTFVNAPAGTNISLGGGISE